MQGTTFNGGLFFGGGFFFFFGFCILRTPLIMDKWQKAADSSSGKVTLFNLLSQKKCVYVHIFVSDGNYSTSA